MIIRILILMFIAWMVARHIDKKRQYEQTSNKMYIPYTQFNKRNKRERESKSCNIHLFKETIYKINQYINQYYIKINKIVLKSGWKW